MRLKGKLQRLLVLSAFFVLNAVLFGCQSTKIAQNVVEPYALLNENSVLYMKIPVKDNKAMFVKIFDSFTENGEKVRGLVYKYIDEIYMVQRADDGGFEEICKGNFPPSMVKNAEKYTEWKNHDFTAANGVNYKIYESDSGMQIAFVDKNTLCMSRNVAEILNRYAVGAEMSENAAKAKEKFEEMDSKNLLFLMAKVYDFMDRDVAEKILPNLDCLYGFSYLKEDGTLDSDVYLEIKESTAQALNGVARVLHFILSVTGENIGVEVEEDKERIHLSHMNVFDF